MRQALAMFDQFPSGKTSKIGNATVIATATIVAMCIRSTIEADAGNYLLIGFE